VAFIFQSPKSKFWIAGFIDRDGRRRNRSTRTTDRRKALKIAEDFETAWRGQLTARQFERVLTEGIERITGETRLNTPFDAFLKDWLSARKAEWAPSSLARAETVLERFADHLGELARRPMRGITRADVTAFRNGVSDAQSARPHQYPQ
jgi:hypothetical protein